MKKNTDTDDSTRGIERKSTDPTTTMSESNQQQTEENREYRVTIWATHEFASFVEGETEDEALENIKELARHERLGTDLQSASTSGRVEEYGNRWNASVWVTEEFVRTVEATSEEEAEEEARDELFAVESIVDSDVDSINARCL